MVRIACLAASLALPAASLAQFAALQDAGQALARGVLSNVLRLNSSQVDRVMNKEERIEAHPYAMDLTDENWGTVLKTGTYNPLGLPLDKNTTWVVTVHGSDQVSRMFLAATDAVARHNSSEAGGTLPANMRFARIDYAKETVLPTLLWVWKPPTIVIVKNGMAELRFFKVGHVAPFHLPMADLLANRERWGSMPLWKGAMAPGGWFSPYLPGLANAAATYHKYMSKIPSFVLLIISGFLMNIIIGFFHKETPKPKAKSVVSRDAQRAATKAMWASEDNEAAVESEAGKDRAQASEAVIPSKEGSSALKESEGKQRKG